MRSKIVTILLAFLFVFAVSGAAPALAAKAHHQTAATKHAGKKHKKHHKGKKKHHKHKKHKHAGKTGKKKAAK